MKKIIAKFGMIVAEALIKNSPGILDYANKKKEEKSFFENNQWWIFIIILSIFVTKLDYINIFENVPLNSIINIIFGIIVLVLLCLFYYEEKNVFRINSFFVKTLIISLIILGSINSFYHIGYAISNLLASIL